MLCFLLAHLFMTRISFECLFCDQQVPFISSSPLFYHILLREVHLDKLITNPCNTHSSLSPSALSLCALSHSDVCVHVFVFMCVKVGHYQLAILTLISGDLSDSPMGTDKEPIDDEAEVEKEGKIPYHTVGCDRVR